MAIQDLFNATICCSCGACRNVLLCEKSIVDTLLANGLSTDFGPQLEGLKYESPNNGRRFEFSEVYKKITELGRQVT